MAGLFSDNDVANLDAPDAAQPAASLGTTPGEAFRAAWEANERYSGGISGIENTADAIQVHLDEFQAKTGETLRNPYRIGWDASNPDGGWQSSLPDIRARMAAKAQALGDPSLNLPADDQLWAEGIDKARAALSNQARTGQGQQFFGTGLASAAADFGSQFADPVNLGLNAVALATLPEGGGIVRSMLGAAAIFGGQQAAQEAITGSYKANVNPDYGPGTAAEDIGEAALGGAGLELGGKALGAAWRALRGTAPEVAARLPTDMQDAGNVAERQADIDANNPFKTGLSGEAAHTEALVKIEADTLADRTPELPAAAQAEGTVPTGDVFAPAQPDAASLIDRQAWSDNPDLFGQAHDLDGKIAQARDQIAQLGGAGEASPFGAISSRVAELKSQLDARTTIGRPGYVVATRKARDDLSQQIAGLQAQSEALSADAANRDAARSQALHASISDLTMRRAAMGPQVNAARRAAADKLGLPIDQGEPVVFDANPSHSGNTFQPPDTETAPEPEAPPAPKTRRGRQKPVEASPAPVPPSPQEIAAVKSNATGGVPARAYAAGKAVRVKYEVAEARDLVTSHDADFNVNPAYPQDMQPRNRASIPARDQVYGIASDLQPERLGPNVEANAGAPIVGPDNIVESGNGRAMAVRMAYRQNREQAGAYRAFLERSGFDTSGMDEPVLIGRRVSTMTPEQRVAFAHAANGSASLRMSTTEQALSDARHIDPDLMALHKGGDISAVGNRKFVRAVAAKMAPGERGGMLTAPGNLSQAGVNRMKAALVARAYGDPAIVARAFDHPDPNIKGIAAALVDAAPDWIKMRDGVARGEIPAGQDITDDVMQAIRSIMRARDTGRPIAEVLNQGDIFQSDTSHLAARLFFKDDELKRPLSRADTADNLSTLARDLKTGGAGRDLFGEEPPTAQERMQSKISRGEGNVVAMTRAAVDPKAVDAGLTDHAVSQALDTSLRRDIEQGRNRVPVIDDQGNPSLGFADKELADIDADQALAKEIQGCAVGQEAAE